MNPSPQDIPSWFCVRTQTKREHIAAEHLKELEGIEVFCPRLRYRKATRRGKVWWIEPLFPGYLLAKFNLAEMERAVTEIPSVPESFVETLRQDVRKRSQDDPETLSVSPILQIGEEVEVAHGPLQGMRGTIVSVAPAAERVKILLDFLGQPQAVDVDLFSILLPRKPIPQD